MDKTLKLLQPGASESVWVYVADTFWTFSSLSASGSRWIGGRISNSKPLTSFSLPGSGNSCRERILGSSLCGDCVCGPAWDGELACTTVHIVPSESSANHHQTHVFWFGSIPPNGKKSSWFRSSLLSGLETVNSSSVNGRKPLIAAGDPAVITSTKSGLVWRRWWWLEAPDEIPECTIEAVQRGSSGKTSSRARTSPNMTETMILERRCSNFNLVLLDFHRSDFWSNLKLESIKARCW